MSLSLETLRRSLPEDWCKAIAPGGKWGLGYDVATSDGAMSNPSSIVARQQIGSHAIEWVVTSWKSRVDDDAFLLLRTLASDLMRCGHRLRACCVDASNERFHATQVRKALRGICPVWGIGGGDVLKWGGETHKAKTLLGSLYVLDYEDNHLTVPSADWVKADRRLVKTAGGSYAAETDAKGRHADTFDAGKLAKWACLGGAGGRVEAKAPDRASATQPNGNRSRAGDTRTTALHPSVKPRTTKLIV